MAGFLKRALGIAGPRSHLDSSNPHIDNRSDIVIGCFTAYDYDQIRLWVNSLDRSGFTGLKLILCAEAEPATLRELERRDYQLVRFELNDKEDPYSILRDRYWQLYRLLRSANAEQNYRFVIAPDMKDVVFQTNPSTWLEQNAASAHLVAGSECLTHQSEYWSRDMMLELFGTSIFDLIKDKIIYNAGTMAGRQSVFSEFCLEVFLILLHSKTSKTYKIYPDQAAVNLLLHLTRYFEATKFAAAESAWACQLGTVGNVDYKVLLTEPEPRFNGLEVVTSLGTPFSLVHQYDRFPHWMGPIRERFWT